jgi:uncharacterized protein YndB with AHSA1/START domain
MTTAFTTSVTMAQGPELVWQTLTDWDRLAEWMPGVERAGADGPTAAGMALTFSARGKDRTSHVASIEPGRSLVLRSVQGGVTADYDYRLTPTGQATEVELTVEVTTTGAWRVLAPVIRGAIRRADAGQLADLERAVRARASSP